MNFSEEQFEKIMAKIGSQQRGSFANFKTCYDGTRDAETVEAFLTAATVFKSVENIGDEEAVKSVPLILKGEAAIWWNGVKDNVGTWADFQARIRYAFAPKRPAFLVYQDIMGIKQEDKELTERFISKKRALFAQLPEPGHTESQQLDMIYGQLRLKIRSKIPRDSVSTYDGLLRSARGVEQMLLEKQPGTSSERTNEAPIPKKIRCGYCRLPGHSAEVCRRKAREQGSTSKNTTAASTQPALVQPTGLSVAAQFPSPSQPKFSCYGCGAPGVVRSKCPTCLKKTPIKQEISFCAISVKTDARPRPIIGISVGRIMGTAYVDSCAKTSVASYGLYECLRQQGYSFCKQRLTVTLADGGKTQREVFTAKVPVNVCDRVIPTTFIVFPEARESRTLLGVGFIQDAGIVLNIPQLCWHFVDNPDDVYDLYMEGSEEISMAHVETTPLSSPARRQFLKDVQLPDIISPLPSTPDRTIGTLAKRGPTLPEASACGAMDLRLPNSPREAALPASSAAVKPYHVIRIDPPTPPKRQRELFDGYSPSFIDFMYRDAQMNTHIAEVNLSPHSRMLFPSDDGSDDVSIGSISVEDVDP